MRLKIHLCRNDFGNKLTFIINNKKFLSFGEKIKNFSGGSLFALLESKCLTFNTKLYRQL